MKLYYHPVSTTSRPIILEERQRLAEVSHCQVEVRWLHRSCCAGKGA